MSNGPADRPDILVCSDPDALSFDAACRFAGLASAVTRSGRAFTVALAGGRTPMMLYALLAMPPFRDAIDWANVHLFFGDERCVPVESESSNYRMARDTLITPVGLSKDNVHRIQAEDGDIHRAVRLYDEELGRYFGNAALPRFDLALLGMGADGHCASLFPHKSALSEVTRRVVESEPGLEPFVPRITLTLPVLNNVANTLFLVTGHDKADTVVRVLSGPEEPQELPAQSVRPADGTLTWLLDRSAGARLLA